MDIPASVLAELVPNSIDNYEYVAVHHTADNCQTQTAQDVATEEIPRGYSTIPYNFLIPKSGVVYVGRPITYLPAATGGLNTKTIAICFEGNFQTDDANYAGETPSGAQLSACVMIINDWLKPKCKNLHTLIGHYQASLIEHDPSNATACPGNLLIAHLDNLRTLTGLQAPVIS